MQLIELLNEPALLALIGGFGGLILGLVARLGRFCTLGAIEDAAYGGSYTRLRMWGIATAVAVLGVAVLQLSGRFDPGLSIYQTQGVSPFGSVLGGLMFGYGMALAGNCGFGALARLGGGDLRSLMIVLVMGVVAYLSINGLLAPLRIALFGNGADIRSLGTIPNVLEQATGASAPITSLVIGVAVLLVSIGNLRAFDRAALWGIPVGIAILTGWAGTYWVATEGFSGNPVVSHSFTAPVGSTLLYAMTSTGASLSFGVGSVLGVILGAMVGSLIKGHFRWEACDDPRELRRQLLGASLMGFGGVVAFGCSVGQGLSAMSVLAVSAPLTLFAIYLGARIGLRQLVSGLL